MRKAFFLLLLACDVYDGPPEPSLAYTNAGLLTDPAAPLGVTFDKPLNPDTLNFEIARYELDDHGRLADEADPLNGKLSLLFSHNQFLGELGGTFTVSDDRTSMVIVPTTPLPITPRLVLIFEPGLADDMGTATTVRRKLVFGYQFNLTCNKPSTLVPSAGHYFFLIDVKQPVATQVRLFASIQVDPATGAFKAQFVRAARNPDPNRCPMPCNATEACQLLPTPACVVPSTRASNTDEFPDFIADTTSPASFQFTATGCVVDQPDGTAQFVNAPVDVFVTSPTVTLRNARLTSQFAKDPNGVLRVQGALSADDVLLGNASSGKGIGGLDGRLIPPGQEPQGIPDPPP